MTLRLVHVALFLSAVLLAEANPLSRDSVKNDIIGIDNVFLSLVQTVGQHNNSHPEPQLFDLRALDYLSSVYEDADYYTTGNCGAKSAGNPNASIYIGGLPDRMLANFQKPVKGRITSPFGLRDDGSRMHKGVDISLKKGDDVLAAFDGRVLRVGYETKGYGYFIILEHGDGFQSRYAHLQQPLVKPGDEVTSGAHIALGGTSGNSTGPHLHFEIRCGRTPLDPTPLINQ